MTGEMPIPWKTLPMTASWPLCRSCSHFRGSVCDVLHTYSTDGARAACDRWQRAGSDGLAVGRTRRKEEAARRTGSGWAASLRQRKDVSLEPSFFPGVGRGLCRAKQRPIEAADMEGETVGGVSKDDWRIDALEKQIEWIEKSITEIDKERRYLEDMMTAFRNIVVKLRKENER